MLFSFDGDCAAICDKLKLPTAIQYHLFVILTGDGTKVLSPK